MSVAKRPVGAVVVVVLAVGDALEAALAWLVAVPHAVGQGRRGGVTAAPLVGGEGATVDVLQTGLSPLLLMSAPVEAEAVEVAG